MAATSHCPACSQEVGDFAGHLCVEQYGWFYETMEHGMGNEEKIWRWTLYDPGVGTPRRRAYRAIFPPARHDKPVRMVTA